LRRIKKKIDKKRCPLCAGEEDAKSVLLSCPETRKQTKEIVSKKWLNKKEELAYKKILNCTNITLLIDLGRYLDKR
jgi:hypothetical protein